MDDIDLLYVGIWAIIGSIIGFFAFTNTPSMNIITRLYRCALSVGIGVLISLPISTYLVEQVMLSKKLSLMLGGVSAFGLPDFILKYLPTITLQVVNKFIDTKIGKDKYDSGI